MKQLREAALARLEGYRMQHSIGVEKAAIALARRFGADEEKAAIAGIFHDITKNFSPKQQLALCAEHHIAVNSLEKGSPKLLHGKTAAALAQAEHGIDDEEILDALRYHTTGRKDMTLLDKIVYLADYIEENRSFEGVEQARALAEVDIDLAIMYALETALRDILNRRLLIHMDTIEALNSLYEMNLSKNGVK